MLVLSPTTDEVIGTNLSTYIQSAHYNQMDGNVLRKFAPLPADLKANPFLGALIRLDFANSGLASDHLLYRVGIHLVRYVTPAHGEAFSYPLHKDGEWVTFSHLGGRHNVSGGGGVITDNDRKTLWEGTQEEFLDTFGVVDKHVLHRATPVSRVDPWQEGYRDVALIDFTPLIDLSDTK